MRRLLPCAFVAVLSSSACVHLTIKKADGLSEKGLHFSRPAAYLWITVNDKGQCIPSITYLPDPQQDYVMRVWPWGFGTVSFKPTLKDGWNLTALESTADTKAPETLKALGGFAKDTVSAAKDAAALAAAEMVQTKPATAQEGPIGPGLYRLVYEKDGEGNLNEVPTLKAVFHLNDKTGNAITCPALLTPKPEKSEKSEKAKPKKPSDTE